jgi:hypothetical protein
MNTILGILSRVGGAGAACAAALLLTSAGLAQQKQSEQTAATLGTAPATMSVRQTTGDPRRDTLLKMQKPITIELNDTPIEDAIKYIVDMTGADIEPLWSTENQSQGLSKDARVTVSAKGMPALEFLEKVLGSLEDGLAKHTWQMTEQGTMQVSTKERLNKYKRVEIYDINDLLFILPIYDNAPQIDLNQVLQQAGRGGGGGGQSPFRENQGNNRREDPPPKKDRAKDIQDIITQIIDPEQWQSGGGEGGSITYHEGTLIVNAADYLHRQVNGYKWWPTFRASASTGRRYVQLNIDTGISQLQRPLRTLPVGATAGGTGGGGIPPGGG